jgi:hypothetical protein
MIHAHRYKNDLVEVERGRRAAIREIQDADPAVAQATALLRAATSATRQSAVRALAKARNEAFTAEERARVRELDREIRLSLRAATKAYWGTYLIVEAAADASRQEPLYDRDMVTPIAPRFRRWTGEGSIGVQLQNNKLTCGQLLAARDTQARLVLRPPRDDRDRVQQRYGDLWLRVGSEGRAPVWATWPIKLHRHLPDAGQVKWIRVTARRVGTREEWSCEVTVDDPAPRAVELDDSLSGAVAVELEWCEDGGRVRVASTLDHEGRRGSVWIGEHLVAGLRKPEGIRSVRDTLLNDLRERLARAIVESRDAPMWLLGEASTLSLWRSPSRFRELARRWRERRDDSARGAYELLDAWEIRDDHLLDYEDGQRKGAIRARTDLYRRTAADLARRYRTVVLPERDLSREAMFGGDSSWRQFAGVSTLVLAIKHAARSTSTHPWPKDDHHEWLERAIEGWRAAEASGAARGRGNEADLRASRGGAWARRKARKTERSGEGAPREVGYEDAE